MMSFAEFVTPNDHAVSALYRSDTSDWNTISACLHDDEYGLAERSWEGVAIDVGAHVGGATMALLADNPGLRVVAIEALPQNVALLRSNLERNGFLDRVEVIEGAANCGTEPVTIAYGTNVGTRFVREHRFIGGGIWQDGGPGGERVSSQPVSLSSIVARYGPISLVKIDCEGCEWSFLDDPAIALVSEIRGEYHPREGNGPAELRALLEATHDVTLDDAEVFGPFRAVRRG